MDDTTVQLVGSGAVVLAAAVPALLNRAWLKRHVGRANGTGTLNQMAEAILISHKQHSDLDDVRFAEQGRKLDLLLSARDKTPPIK